MKGDAVISLLLSLGTALVIGASILVLTRSGSTFLFWISGIASGIAIRGSVSRLRVPNVQSETTQRIQRAGESYP